MSESELRELFERQALLVRRLEGELELLTARIRIVEHNLPVMLAFVDAGERYRFHNEAYRRGFGLSAEQIDGRTMREVLGESVYAGIADRVRQALSGTCVSYERTFAGTRQIRVHLVPCFDELRAVVGFYSLLIDLQAVAEAGSTPANTAEPIAPLDPAEDAPELHKGAVAKAQAAWRAATERIKSAIRNDEFVLYYQAIKDLATEVPPFHSIFVREVEEERNMVSPGAFFALAEEYGLMSELDRWVVCGVLGWMSARKRERADWRPSLYSINLSRDTIGDPYFPEFVQAQVAQSDLPAEALCFEFQESDVAALPVDSAELVRNLQSLGCRTMLGGFGRVRVSVEILKEMRFDFLKIDGSVVFNILRSEASVSKMRSIVRLAHTVGINTVAELVENPETVVKLRELEVDYAQGAAIAPVLPLHAIN
ncbi:MAG: EAL domain-containing protein [Betaproteobacteria bacterium]|nr:EAL domain-containing protein [Betaproteobacteria bacterium]